MKTPYDVRREMDDTYRVEILVESPYEDDYYDVVFRGNLSDCDAWIRLTEGGYM